MLLPDENHCKILFWLANSIQFVKYPDIEFYPFCATNSSSKFISANNTVQKISLQEVISELI